MTDGHENRYSSRPWEVFNFVAEIGTETLSCEKGDRDVVPECWEFRAKEVVEPSLKERNSKTHKQVHEECLPAQHLPCADFIERAIHQ